MQRRDSSRQFLERSGGVLFMVYTVAVILIVIWLLCWISDFAMGGLIHLLLLAGVVLIIGQRIRGRKRNHNDNLKI